MTARRFVLQSHEPDGHGSTELLFQRLAISVEPASDDGGMVLREGSLVDDSFAPSAWYEAHLPPRSPLSRCLGQTLQFVDCYSDGWLDVALVFRFDGGAQFSLVLSDRSLILARELEPLQGALSEVRTELREQLR